MMVFKLTQTGENMEDEREFGAFREDWDQLLASAIADMESDESLQEEADWAAEQQALLQV